MHSNVGVISLVLPDEHLGCICSVLKHLEHLLVGSLPLRSVHIIRAVASGISVISLADATVRRRLHTQVHGSEQKAFPFLPNSRNAPDVSARCIYTLTTQDASCACPTWMEFGGNSCYFCGLSCLGRSIYLCAEYFAWM